MLRLIKLLVPIHKVISPKQNVVMEVQCISNRYIGLVSLRHSNDFALYCTVSKLIELGIQVHLFARNLYSVFYGLWYSYYEVSNWFH